MFRRHPEAYVYIVFFSVVGYIGVTFVLAMIKFFGAFIAITVTSCRKFITIGLSFVIFPKPMTVHYFIASFLVVCGLACHIYAKNAETIDWLLDKYFNIQLGQNTQSQQSLPKEGKDLESGASLNATGSLHHRQDKHESMPDTVTESFSITSPGQMRAL